MKIRESLSTFYVKRKTADAIRGFDALTELIHHPFTDINPRLADNLLNPIPPHRAIHSDLPRILRQAASILFENSKMHANERSARTKLTPARTLRAKSAQKFAKSDRCADRCPRIRAKHAQTPIFVGSGAGGIPLTIAPAFLIADAIFSVFPKNVPQPKKARSKTAEKRTLLRNTDR